MYIYIHNRFTQIDQRNTDGHQVGEQTEKNREPRGRVHGHPEIGIGHHGRRLHDRRRQRLQRTRLQSDQTTIIMFSARIFKTNEPRTLCR